MAASIVLDSTPNIDPLTLQISKLMPGQKDVIVIQFPASWPDTWGEALRSQVAGIVNMPDIGSRLILVLREGIQVGLMSRHELKMLKHDVDEALEWCDKGQKP